MIQLQNNESLNILFKSFGVLFSENKDPCTLSFPPCTPDDSDCKVALHPRTFWGARLRKAERRFKN